MRFDNKLVILALLFLATGLAIYGWQQHKAVKKAEEEVALNTTRMLREIFVAKGDLRVGQLKGVVLSSTVNDGPIFQSTQITKVPVTVNYMLDIAAAKTGAFVWNAERRTLRVDIPDVSIEPPAVDMTRAEVWQNGIWISRKAGQDLQAQAAQRIAIRATERARSEENLAHARAVARQDMRALVQRPLQAIGFGDVEIVVAFPWEGRRSPEQWDRSRNLADVATNRF